eukprot:13749479-Heterocapsa_arctica.AAC.1
MPAFYTAMCRTRSSRVMPKGWLDAGVIDCVCCVCVCVLLCVSSALLPYLIVDRHAACPCRGALAVGDGARERLNKHCPV